jgi:hypothetical protein
VSVGLDQLTPRQRELLAAWLPGAAVVRDHGWGLKGGTAVLELAHDGERYVAKAGPEGNHHVARELRAHREWLRPWTSTGHAPELVHGDDEARLVLTRFVPGELVQGTPHEAVPDVYAQAGRLLAVFHGQLGVEDAGYWAREQERTLDWLGTPHRIPGDVEARVRASVAGWELPPETLVPTHGDWHPRNWLVHEGSVSVIDFGGADLRPAATDFVRLAAQQFRTDPTLEAAFLRGYGGDPREAGAWRRHRLSQAVSTAAWAYHVGDEEFEQQGHRMVAEALAAGSGLT